MSEAALDWSRRFIDIVWKLNRVALQIYWPRTFFSSRWRSAFASQLAELPVMSDIRTPASRNFLEKMRHVFETWHQLREQHVREPGHKTHSVYRRRDAAFRWAHRRSRVVMFWDVQPPSGEVTRGHFVLKPQRAEVCCVHTMRWSETFKQKKHLCRHTNTENQSANVSWFLVFVGTVCSEQPKIFIPKCYKSIYQNAKRFWIIRALVSNTDCSNVLMDAVDWLIDFGRHISFWNETSNRKHQQKTFNNEHFTESCVRHVFMMFHCWLIQKCFN